MSSTMKTYSDFLGIMARQQHYNRTAWFVLVRGGRSAKRKRSRYEIRGW